jgi:hypothetical protein
MFSNVANQCEVQNEGAPSDSVLGGTSDIILASGGTWLATPQLGNASSTTFSASATAQPVTGQPSFPQWETQGWPLAGDFDGDGLGDFALVGGGGWGTFPVGFASTAAGTFNGFNEGITGFNVASQSISFGYSNAPLAPVAGDFNGDGCSDIALVGGQSAIGGTSWNQIPIAF